MESHNELKEIDIKICMCYFNDIIKIEDFDNILSDENSYENIFVYEMSYKTLITAKSLCIRFDKVDGFIRVYDATRYSMVFGPEIYVIFNRISFLISQKSGITYVISHNYKIIQE